MVRVIQEKGITLVLIVTLLETIFTKKRKETHMTNSRRLLQETGVVSDILQMEEILITRLEKIRVQERADLDE